MKRRNGFTLIELLVVVAIIGVLLAILYPTTARMLQRAKGIGCKANMRALAQAHYVSDGYDGPVFVPSTHIIGPFPPQHSSLIVNKLVTKDQFLCPLDKGVRRQPPYPWGGSQPIDPPWFSYTRNGNAFPPWQPTPVELVRAPSSTMLLMEEWELAPMNDAHVHPNQWDLLSARHEGRGGMAFHDGHVEYVDAKVFNTAPSAWRIQHYFNP